MELKEIIYLLEKENPNNMTLGQKVRELVWELLELDYKINR